MDFNDASAVEQVCYSIRLSDWPRAKNRVRIQNLFNGVPPFNEADAEANGIKINVNPLTATTLGHDARAQFYNAFLRPGRYFDAATDYGPKFKRTNFSNIVTQEINKKMKRSMLYFETFRNKFAMDVLHGIAPAFWRNSDFWCPNAAAIEDVGIPSNTMLTMENLPFFYIYRSFTVPELMKLVNRENRDRAWNMPLVKSMMKQVDKDTQALMNSNWPEVWSPEKTAERIKGDGGFYSSDQVQTINVFDFYFWNDKKKEEGWNRRMILDPWSEPNVNGTMDYDKKKEFSRGSFLFDSGPRKYASKISELLSFQFADLSAIAPFRYHSVRSLGFLVYGVCNLQNRLFCRLNESAFEAAMQYFRINSPDDADRALKIDLINRGVIDKSVEFVKQQDRWQVNTPVIEAAMGENRSHIESNSNSWTQQGANAQGGSDRKTKFQVMAEIQQTTALVQSAFNQAYRYQEGEYREIFRRFCKVDSDDIDVREFRACCLRKGVPEKMLCEEYWDIMPTQVMGDGNKTMEMAISEQLLSMRNLYDPEPQRELLRKVTFNITGDAGLAERWVPETPAPVSDSMHDAQLATAALMMGLPVTLKTGMDHKEYAITLIGNLGLEIQKATQSGGMATKDQIAGFQNVAQAASQHLQILAQDETEKQFVNQANQQLGKLMNEVKAFAQRLQQQMQKVQEQNGGMKPEDKAKIQATMATTAAKIKSGQMSAAQKAAHKQVAFEQEQQRKAQEFESEQARKNLETAHEVARKRVKSVE